MRTSDVLWLWSDLGFVWRPGLPSPSHIHYNSFSFPEWWWWVDKKHEFNQKLSLRKKFQCRVSGCEVWVVVQVLTSTRNKCINQKAYGVRCIIISSRLLSWTWELFSLIHHIPRQTVGRALFRYSAVVQKYWKCIFYFFFWLSTIVRQTKLSSIYLKSEVIVFIRPVAYGSDNLLLAVAMVQPGDWIENLLHIL